MNPIDSPSFDGDYALRRNCCGEGGATIIQEASGNDVYSITYAGWDFYYSGDIYFFKDSLENRARFMSID